MRHCCRIFACAVAVLACGGAAQAQYALDPPKSGDGSRGVVFGRPSIDAHGSAFLRFFSEGEWYVSFGLSKQYYAPTDIHVSQPSLGNDFTIHDVHGHDEADWSALLKGDLLGPQYNIRIGRFINDRFAVEFSLEHSKYTVTDGQIANVTGMVAAPNAPGPNVLTKPFFEYMLHNGANHVMLNLVDREPLYGKINEPFSVAFIGKVGAGVVVPHVEDTIQGNRVDVGSKSFSNALGLHNGWWQYGGWTVGAEGGFRVPLFKPAYFEITDKVAYARFWNLQAYQGSINHGLLMNEIVFSLGVTFDGTGRH
jgi:hypothetical protein